MLTPLILIAAAAGLLAASFWLFQYFFAPPGSLQITSLQPGAEVILDGQVVGKTDYRESRRAGRYQIEVRSATRSSLPWKRQLGLEPATLTSVDVDLGPSSTFSGSTILSLNRGSGLSVSTTPLGARVFLDATDIGTAPLTRPAPSPGNHTLKIAMSGYLDKEIQIVTTSGWKLTAEVTLFKNPDFGGSLSAQSEIKVAPPSELKIVPRSELSLDKILGSYAVSNYSPWTKAELWSLNSTDPALIQTPTEWLRGLYYHAVVHLLLPDLPFQYLIDPAGVVYEGRSGGNWAVTTDISSGLLSSSQAPITRPGVVEVGYLGAKEVSPAAGESFRKLVLWLGQPPKLAALAGPLTDVTVDAGKQVEVSLSFHNSGFATWSNFGDQRVLLSSGARISIFYTSGNWVDNTHPATLNQTYTPNGQDGKFKFLLTAPAYGGDFDEIFNLTQGARVAEGSEIHLKVHVSGPPKPVAQVKIEDTGVGFLRVRSGSGVGYAEIARVIPGETYELLSEQSGWYQIKLKDGRSGWVSAQFVTKL